MKSWIKENYSYCFFVWSMLNIMAWTIRLMANDCAHRYIDYIAPFSFFHCEIKP